MKKSAGDYYNKISKLYDLMYNKKTGFDHHLQVRWVDAWREKLQLSKKILDLACGTGKHLQEFKRLGYHCSGLDASSELLKIAHKELKKVPLIKGYFQNFKIDENFPLITSFFNSMAYNATEKELSKTFRTVHHHLEEKGIFVFDLFCTTAPKKVFQCRVFETPSLMFSRTFVGVPTKQGYKSAMYYIVFDGKKSEIIQETSFRGIFSDKTVTKALHKVGFNLLYHGEGYAKGMTVFVAQKKSI